MQNEPDLIEIVRSAVDPEPFDDFILSLNKYKSQKIQSRTFILRVHKLLIPNHPANWHQFLNTCDPELRLSFLATSQHRSSVRAIAGAPPPGLFPSADAVRSVQDQLNYRALGRLASACRWMRANIKQDDLKQALQRARQTLGVFTKVPSLVAGIKLRSPWDDVLELHALRGGRFYRVVMDGVIFVANPTFMIGARSRSFYAFPGEKKGFTTTMLRFEPLLNEILDLDGSGAGSDARVWFDAVQHQIPEEQFSFTISIMHKSYSGWTGPRYDDLEFTIQVDCSRFM